MSPASINEGVLLPFSYPPDWGHRAEHEEQEDFTSRAAEEVGCLPTGYLSRPQSSL